MFLCVFFPKCCNYVNIIDTYQYVACCDYVNVIDIYQYVTCCNYINAVEKISAVDKYV